MALFCSRPNFLDKVARKRSPHKLLLVVCTIASFKSELEFVLTPHLEHVGLICQRLQVYE